MHRSGAKTTPLKNHQPIALEDYLISTLTWSEPRSVTTRNGNTRTIQEARPTHDFWALWGRYRGYLRNKGLICERFKGCWVVTYWHPREEVRE